jgi:ribosomal protein S18 acetylase RimI-like enzyme
MVSEPMQIRNARPEDAPVIAEQRTRMFLEMGRVTEAGVPQLLRVSTSYLSEALANETYRGWLMESADGKIIGGAGLLLRPLMPRPDAMSGPEAVVLNVYVEPEFRRQGVARALMQALLHWCRTQDIPRIVLHATPNGQPLYESLGFKLRGEMIYEGP